MYRVGLWLRKETLPASHICFSLFSWTYVEMVCLFNMFGSILNFCVSQSASTINVDFECLCHDFNQFSQILAGLLEKTNLNWRTQTMCNHCSWWHPIDLALAQHASYATMRWGGEWQKNNLHLHMPEPNLKHFTICSPLKSQNCITIEAKPSKLAVRHLRTRQNDPRDIN